jgi:hypothetical protein
MGHVKKESNFYKSKYVAKFNPEFDVEFTSSLDWYAKNSA